MLPGIKGILKTVVYIIIYTVNKKTYRLAWTFFVTNGGGPTCLSIYEIWTHPSRLWACIVKKWHHLILYQSWSSIFPSIYFFGDNNVGCAYFSMFCCLKLPYNIVLIHFLISALFIPCLHLLILFRHIWIFQHNMWKNYWFR